MKILVLLSLFGAAFAADIIDPATCTEFPCLIFEDNFDFLDHDVWEHEITMTGGGNDEFQTYVNNRSVSYVRDSVLYIKPALVSEWKDDDFVYSGTLDLWAMNGRNEVCTGNQQDGCLKQAEGDQIINPILSARMRSKGSFSFRYGLMEIRAKVPKGAWLWPAIWLLPENFGYGPWPACGEIDVLESRGNDVYGDLGNEYASSTLHWGPYGDLNSYYMTTAEFSLSDGSSFADDFHTWTVEWTSDYIRCNLDGEEYLYIDPGNSFWEFGNFSSLGIDNPWSEGGKMAPFDDKYYFIINNAVGGSGGFFPDGTEPADPEKPWTDDDPAAMKAFWDARDTWLPTWQDITGKISEDTALKVDYIRVYKNTEDDL